MKKEEILAKSQQEFNKKNKQDERELAETARAGHYATIAALSLGALIIFLILFADKSTGSSNWDLVFHTVVSICSLIVFVRNLHLYIKLRRKAELISAIIFGSGFIYSFIKLVLKMFEII